MRVDNEFPISELQRIIFPIYYRNSADIFPKDRYGNDALISQVRMYAGQNASVRDVDYSYLIQFG